MAQRIVIAGAGLAGVSAAAALRKEGFDGAITIVGAEPEPPYDRPPLSKQYLRGEKSFDKILLRPDDFYAANDIELLPGLRVTRIDVDNKVVDLQGQEEVPYDRLLIATGSRNRVLNVPGAGLEGVLDLRTVADASRIRTEIGAGKRAVLVGMGFIGSEVAASLIGLGVGVSVLETLPVPFGPVLGEQVGRAIEQLHRDHGVEVRTGEAVEGFEGSHRVEAVRLAGGATIDCDFALVGIGVVPRTELAEAAGIEVNNGIVVDACCRTSAPDVFAAGDVARHFHPIAGRHLRVEHWQNALKQGEAAARNMIGMPGEYTEVHWFWSDQYDCNIQYTGFHGPWDHLVVRGSIEERKFTGFYLESGKVTGAVAMNNGRDLRRAKELVRASVAVDPELLADPGFDLRTPAG
ncbi:MAG: NAD(P)/FAD-dependent oxidoreductase [Actinomycetota bacterium]